MHLTYEMRFEDFVKENMNNSISRAFSSVLSDMGLTIELVGWEDIHGGWFTIPVLSEVELAWGSKAAMSSDLTDGWVALD